MTSHSLKAVNSIAKLPTAQTAGMNVKLIEPSENQPVKLKQLLELCLKNVLFWYVVIPKNYKI